MIHMTHEQFARYCIDQMLGNAADETHDRGLDPWFDDAIAAHDKLADGFAAYHDAMHAVRGRPIADHEYADEDELDEAYFNATNDHIADQLPHCCAMTLPPLSDMVYGTWEEDVHPDEATKHYGQSYMTLDEWTQHQADTARTKIT